MPSPHLPVKMLLAWSLGLMSSAHADGVPMPRTVPEAYVRECAACHLAYPPGLLPAPSWSRLMGGLDAHYGTDASVDEATVRQLSQWLQTHAGTYKRVREAPPQDRITRSAWFERKHRRIEPGVWQLPSVNSRANCSACHGEAQRGVFDDERLRFPAGLTPAQKRAWSS